jgi:hypothetical protein
MLILEPMQELEQIKENKIYNHPSFLIKESKSFSLIVEVSKGILRLLISDDQKNILYLQEIKWDTNIENSKAIELVTLLLKKNDILYSNFKEVKLLFHSSLFTIVPTEFYNETSNLEWLRFNAGDKHVSVTETNLINFINANLIYQAQPEWKLFFTRNFLNLKTSHFLVSFIEYQIKKTKKISNPSIWVLGDVDSIFICVTRNEMLQFANTFEINAPEDFVYSIMLIYESLGIDLNNELIYFGEINFEQEAINLLKKYLPKFSLGTNPEEINCELYVKKHQFQTLFSSLLCE